jgi:hypothetical protein
MYQSALNRSRNDKFSLIIELPLKLKELYDATLKEENKIDSLQFSIFGSPVPEIKIPSVDIPYGGQVYKTSSTSRPVYNDLNIKFLVDNGYKNYWILWKWLDLFNDHKKGGTTLTEVLGTSKYSNDIPILESPMKDFVSKFWIFGLDEFNNKIISFSYTNAFPTSLGQLNFNNQNSDEITCEVSFSFNQLHVNLLKNINESTC